jgi:hypothetical protein
MFIIDAKQVLMMSVVALDGINSQP